jgi:hypothetical protein
MILLHKRMREKQSDNELLKLQTTNSSGYGRLRPLNKGQHACLRHAALNFNELQP